MLPFDERDRESVLRDLESPDEEVRRLAVERASALPPAEVIPRLVERLGDEDWRVRKASIERLVAWPDAEGVAAALIDALGDGDNPGRRNAAVEALIAGAAGMLPHLIRAAAVDDRDVRKFVVDALAGIGDERATDALIGRLEDEDPNVCASAADALGVIGGERAAVALEAAATDGARDPLVRFSALHALAALDLPLRARSLGAVLEDPVLRPAGLALLGRVADDTEALEVLLKGLTCGARATREAAIRSVLRLVSGLDGASADAVVERVRGVADASPAIIESAVERLEDADLSTALALIQFLGLVRTERAAVPILRAGADEALTQVARSTLESMGGVAEDSIDAAWPDLDAEARRAACVVFGRTRGERGSARLVSALEDLDPGLRAAAARSLGERGCVEAVVPLVHRLEQSALDEDLDAEDERSAVVEALVQLARPREGEGTDSATADHAIGLLTALLHGASESVRLAVATVLGSIGRRQDTEVVTLLLKDASEQVRRAAVDALAHLEPGTAAEPLRMAMGDESPYVRIATAVALGASRSDAVFDDLCRLAEDEDARVRAPAIRAIVVRSSASAQPERRAAALALLDRACSDEALVALAAIEAVTEIGGEPAGKIDALLRREEPEVVREAVRCLGIHAASSDLEGLVPLVAHPDWSVRAEVLHVLTERQVKSSVPAILRRLETERDEFVRSETLRALERLEG